MSSTLNLTDFGFTPTESLVYEVLLKSGPGTGYAIARSAGLARANAYSALEGLVLKGAARVEEGRPKRYRPEPPSTLIARIVDRQGQALDSLSQVLADISVPASPTLVELGSARGVLQLLAHEIARAQSRVALLLPADAFPVLTPALRKAAGSGVELELAAVAAADAAEAVELSFATVSRANPTGEWPGDPILFVVDDRGAMLGFRQGEKVSAHWGTGAVLIAATTVLIRRLRG